MTLAAPVASMAVSEYRVSLLPATHPDYPAFFITIEDRGTYYADDREARWAVCWMGRCLSLANEWDYEPTPSSRDEAWILNHRFSLPAAQQVAQFMVSRIEVNGWHPRQLLEKENHGNLSTTQ